MIILYIIAFCLVYLFGFITATIKLSKNKPTEEHQIAELHNIEWYIIIEMLRGNGEIAMYNRLRMYFSPDQIEQIYDCAILQDIINRTNNGTEL